MHTYIYIHSHANEVSQSLWNNLLIKTASGRYLYIDLLHKSIFWFYMASPHEKSFANIL